MVWCLVLCGNKSVGNKNVQNILYAVPPENVSSVVLDVKQLDSLRLQWDSFKNIFLPGL